MKRLALAFSILLLAASSFAVPLSGEYLRTRNTDTAPTNVAGYGTYHTSAAGVPKYRTAAGVEYAMNPSGPNTITVGVLGDYTTIGAAITAAAARTPSATNRIAILVYPGVYAEQSLELPDYVDLIGVSMHGCVISKASTAASGDARQAALLSVPYNSLVRNLTMNNTRVSSQSPCVNVGWGWSAGTTSGYSIRLQNLLLTSSHADTLCISGNNTLDARGLVIESLKSDTVTIYGQASGTYEFRDCSIKSNDATLHGAAVWICGTGLGKFYGCTFWNNFPSDTGAFLLVDNGGDGGGTTFRVECHDCTFLEGIETPGDVVVASSGSGWKLKVRGGEYAAINAGAGITVSEENLGDGDKTFGGDVEVTGDVTAGRHVCLDGSNNETAMTPGALSTEAQLTISATTSLSLSAGTGVSVFGEVMINGDSESPADTTIGGSGGVLLFADSANHRVGIGTSDPAVMLDVNGAANAAGLSSTSTQWRYFDAVSCAAGALSYAVADVLSFPDAWWHDAVTGVTHITTPHDAIQTYVPVSYEAGTVVTRISVRWQGVGANDGVIVTLQKRQGGTASAAWSTVGAAQTYTGTAETNSVYDLADETMTAGYEYRVAVKSVVATAGALLWEIGIETSKRSY